MAKLMMMKRRGFRIAARFGPAMVVVVLVPPRHGIGTAFHCIRQFSGARSISSVTGAQCRVNCIMEPWAVPNLWPLWAVNVISLLCETDPTTPLFKKNKIARQKHR